MPDMKNNERAVQIGRRIKQLRMERNWSQGELGKVIGVSNTMISHYESGRNAINAEDLDALARELGVTSSYLINGAVVEGAHQSVVEYVKAQLERVAPSDREYVHARLKQSLEDIIALARVRAMEGRRAS